ncbi:hypothetical protein Hypma_013301 [Hypsizygus marmoreus]|uniref:Uncharacterized protein n=1 Tax=Hypsizygus marmoreus TaxID=39966 RepID=A0A369JIS0_HYPMA|nr:hypothetical protein Hypma_013301 [Hypsizygus marmoreus]
MPNIFSFPRTLPTRPSNDRNDSESHQQQARHLLGRPARAIKPARSALHAHSLPIRARTTAAHLQSSAHRQEGSAAVVCESKRATTTAYKALSRLARDWCREELRCRIPAIELSAHAHTMPTPQGKLGQTGRWQTASLSTLTRLGRHCTTTPASTHAGRIGWNKKGERGSGMRRVHRYAPPAVSPRSSADTVPADVQTTTNLCSSSSNLKIGSHATILLYANTDLESPPATPIQQHNAHYRHCPVTPNNNDPRPPRITAPALTNADF